MSPTKRVVLLGLEGALAGELQKALSHQSLNIEADTCTDLGECLGLLEHSAPELIFCPFSRDLSGLLDAVSRTRAAPPVVVVSQFPEVRDWLDALEAGASDYCASPFDPGQLNWILESSINRQSALSGADTCDSLPILA